MNKKQNEANSSLPQKAYKGPIIKGHKKVWLWWLAVSWALSWWALLCLHLRTWSRVCSLEVLYIVCFMFMHVALPCVLLYVWCMCSVQLGSTHRQRLLHAKDTLLHVRVVCVFVSWYFINAYTYTYTHMSTPGNVSFVYAAGNTKRIFHVLLLAHDDHRMVNYILYI